jgi:hypothetical protein
MVQLSIREKDIQGQQKQSILFRQVIVSREKSDIVIDNSTENYSVFNANTTIQNRSYQSFEFIVGPPNLRKFGKFSTEVEYRQLLKITVRLVCASMQELLYNNSNSDFLALL